MIGSTPTVPISNALVAGGLAVINPRGLEQAGYLTRSRDGRRNLYVMHANLPFTAPQHRHHTVGDLIRFLETPPQRNPPTPKALVRGSGDRGAVPQDGHHPG